MGEDTNGRSHATDGTFMKQPQVDPSVLTQEALQREVENLKEIIGFRIGSVRELVDRQFLLIERQRVEQKGDTEKAVGAALVAQKEAVREQTAASERAIAKSETATSKQMDTLNEEQKRVQSALAGSVSIDKFEAYSTTSNTAREVALQRVDERFEDHVKRYEYRQREVDQLIASNQGAAEKVRELAAETARRSNRNIGLMGVAVSVVVVLMRLVGLL